MVIESLYGAYDPPLVGTVHRFDKKGVQFRKWNWINGDRSGIQHKSGGSGQTNPNKTKKQTINNESNA